MVSNENETDVDDQENVSSSSNIEEHRIEHLTTDNAEQQSPRSSPGEFLSSHLFSSSNVLLKCF